ncbi:MAG: permease [Alphaproteobacteria bacterium]|nr:permease [Alphaproteobacteria bacterium]
MADQSLDPMSHKFDISGNIVLWVKSLPRDRVVWSILILLIGTAILSSGRQALDFAGTMGDSLLHTGIFILASVLLAAYIKASGADQLIARALSGRQEKAVLTAAVFGALSPFCSCGVVPLIAALLTAGVPLAPVMAFWLASPIIDPEMMVLTWGVLGLEMAIAKTIAAIAIGLLGGGTVMLLQRAGYLSDVLLARAKPSCGTSTCGTPNLPKGKPVWTFWKETDRRASFVGEIGTMGWFLTRWLSLAFLLEAMMVSWVPLDQVAAQLTTLGDWAVPAAAAVGVPAYLNGYAAIPLVRGLMDIGLQPGAALAFMVAGGVTCIPAAIAVKALVNTISVGFLYAGYVTL